MTGGPYLVGIDVGGTTIKTALLSPGFEVLGEQRRPTPRADGPRAVLDAVADAAERITAEGRRRFGGAPSAVGAAVLGLVDEEAGVARESVAVGWRDVPLRDLLSDRLAVPVALGHDLRAGALAEARLGAGADVRSLLFVALGTGVGGAFVLDGAAPSGAFGRAAEIGHLAVDPAGADCPCGGRGCVETLASATAVAARAHRLAGGSPTAREVAAAVRAGDPAAVRVWRAAVDALATGLAAACVLLDPAAIVVGGGMSLAGEVLLAPLRAALACRVTLGSPPPLRAARLGDRAAVIGAGMLAARLAAPAVAGAS